MKRKFLNLAKIRLVMVPLLSFAAAGDFTATEHLQFLLKANDMWGDAKYKDDYIAHVDSAKQLLENQTARFKMLDDPDKDNTVKIGWVNACGITDEACEANCVLDEPELESKMKEYEMTLCRKTGFSIDEEKLRTNILSKEELVADGLLKASKVLDEWWSMQTLLHYKTFAGVNTWAASGGGPFAWDAGNTTTNIATANYNLSMVATLMQTMLLNQIDNAFFVEKGDLFAAYTNALLESGNAEGKGNAARADFFKSKLVFDMWNFIKAGIAEDMFMVSPNAVAMKTYNRHKDAPRVLDGKVGQTRYTVPSRNLPGVKYDVFYELNCKEVNGKDHIYHTWRLVTQGDIFLNPEPCPIEIDSTTYTPTGVYSFTKV